MSRMQPVLIRGSPRQDTLKFGPSGILYVHKEDDTDAEI